MLSMVFTVDDDPPHSGFSLGHIDVSGTKGSATTRGHIPDERLMVYLSASQLLWDVRVLVDAGKGERAFVGADSSFTLTFTIRKEKQVETRHKGAIIDTSSIAEFTAAVLTSALRLYSSGEERIEEGEDRGPLEDLAMAIKKYEAWQAG